MRAWSATVAGASAGARGRRRLRAFLRARRLSRARLALITSPLPSPLPSPPPKVARNLYRSVFETPRKRCNSNDAFSKSEIFTKELRATLLGNHAWWRGLSAHARASLTRTVEHSSPPGTQHNRSLKPVRQPHGPDYPPKNTHQAPRRTRRAGKPRPRESARTGNQHPDRKRTSG